MLQILRVTLKRSTKTLLFYDLLHRPILHHNVCCVITARKNNDWNAFCVCLLHARPIRTHRRPESCNIAYAVQDVLRPVTLA